MRIFCQVFFIRVACPPSHHQSQSSELTSSLEKAITWMLQYIWEKLEPHSHEKVSPFFRQFPDLLLHVTSLQRSPFQNLHIHLFLEVHSTIRLGIHWRKHAGNRSHHHPTQRPYSQWSPNGSDQSWTSVWRAFQVSQGVPSFQQKKAQ